jgi:SSS family solute:Na+ symporter
MNAHSFGLLDWLVLAAYFAATMVFGLWLGRRQKDARDYFLADRTVPWWAILLSVVATETSALTFISVPALAYLGDLTFLQIALGYIIGRVVVAYTLLPRYFQGELVTAYALLERRFGLATRRFASVAFLFTRVLGDSVRVFATSIPIALLLAAAVPPEISKPVAILLLGLTTIAYTVHGGARAVIWTDVLQTVVFLVGGVVSLWLVGAAVDGGWTTIAASAEAGDKLRFLDLHLGLDRPHTLAAGLLGGAFLSMASHGADQLIVQRLLSSRSLAEARLALIGSGVVVFLMMGLFLLVGVGIHAVYAGQAFASPDEIFPRFILEHMPAGLAGLVVAAILAAAMSTISSSLNSLAAVSLVDLYLPLVGRSAADVSLVAARRASMIWAVVLVGGALLYRDPKTPVVEVALAVASFTYGALLGAFLLAIVAPRARQPHAIAGMATGMAAMAVVVFAEHLGLDAIAGIAWPWFVLIGTSVTVGVGAALATLAPRR